MESGRQDVQDDLKDLSEETFVPSLTGGGRPQRLWPRSPKFLRRRRFLVRETNADLQRKAGLK
ncbi:hypothetical protein A6U98_13625 [Rhizobium sp. WYCCWR10014]|nr:hypothetical protein A6U98_13625 [Rhizobium sp. WYCCWR10014]